MNRKGFTLIEVIAVIIIIGVLALVTVPAVARYITSSKNKTYVAYEENLIVAAQNKVTTCVGENDDSCNLPDKDEKTVFYMNELVAEGYIDEFKDPEFDGYCKTAESYVEVTNSGSADFSYEVCLKCENYASEGEGCSGITNDPVADDDKPVCGTVTGESTRWTNQDRVITVDCSDATTGCTNNQFSIKFKNTAKDSSITIRDKAGNYTDCPVKVYVDKEKPTCRLDRVGGKEEATGWYSGDVRVKLVETGDTGGSQLLTYGIGTSINNRDYNKKDEIKLNQGLTTVIGYVKDMAGNEGICTLDVRVGAPQPQFDIEYGYQIYPNKEIYTLQNMSESGTILTSTTNNPGILFSGLSKHGNITKVVVHLSTGISRDNDVAQVFYSTDGNYSETNSVRVVMDRDSKRIEIPIPEGTYSNIRIDLGEVTGITYNISKIELMMKSGDKTSFYTNKDVSVNVIPKNEVVRTTEYSFEDGASSSYQTSPTKIYGSNFTNKVRTKNIATLISEPQNISVSNIDKSTPTVTITATKSSSGSAVSNNSWSNQTLNFKFTQAGVGISGATIYYCKDTDNTCTPSTIIGNNTSITSYNTLTGIFYIRYKIVSGAGTESSVSSYTAKVDTSSPSCSISKSNTGSTSGVNVSISCSDSGGSSCSSSNTTSDSGLKSSETYTVSDNAGNTATCSVSVSSQRQKKDCSSCGSSCNCSTKWVSSGSTTITRSCSTSFPLVEGNVKYEHNSTSSGGASGCQFHVTKYTKDTDCDSGCSACGCSSWGSWSDTSSCSESSSRQCRTVYE